MQQQFTDEMVLRVARLARLKLTPHDVRRFAPQMNQVLDYVAQLDELDLADVEPMVHAIELTNVLRPDESRPSLSREEALSNAPRSDGKYFLVPPILDEK